MNRNDYLLFQNKILKEIKELESRSLKISIFRFVAGILIYFYDHNNNDFYFISF